MLATVSLPLHPRTISITILYSLNILALIDYSWARLIQVGVRDTPNAIQYSGSWIGPVDFALQPDDPPGGGPNSSVCTIPEGSIYSIDDGVSFTFTFQVEGIAVQLVMVSRANHVPFSVSLDGGPQTAGNTYSVAPGCGVAYEQSDLVLGNHTVTATSHPSTDRRYFELMSIIYDDGSELSSSPVRTPTSSPFPSLPSHSTSSSASPAAVPPLAPNAPSGTDESSTLPSSTITTSHVTSSTSSSGPYSSPTETEAPENTHTRILPRGMIAGVAVAGVLALLVLIILSYLVLRRRVPKRCPEDEHPMEVVSYVPLPSTATTSGKHLLWPPPRIEDVSGGHRPTSTSLAATVGARSSLAPLTSEDIDRIAARVRDTLARSSATTQGGWDGESLPPY